MINDIKYFYYINLASRKDRQSNIEKQIRNSSILSNSLKRFNAINGYDIDLEKIDNKILTAQGKKDIEDRKIKWFGITLTYGSLACAMSHYELFKICANNNDGNILILEDDVILPTDIDDYLDIIQNTEDYDIFYLGIHHNYYTTKQKTEQKNVFNLSGTFWGCFAYVLTPRACSYIINNVFPITVQFDSGIGQQIRKNKLKALCFESNIIKCGQFGTDNQGQNGLKNKQISFNAWNQVFN